MGESIRGHTITSTGAVRSSFSTVPLLPKYVGSARNAPDVFIYGASAFGPDRNGDSHFTIEIENLGARTITGIEWEYDPARGGAEYDARGRTTFRDETPRMLPNQRRKLIRQVHRYTDSFVKNFHLDTVRILRVEYEDGSLWQRPANQ